MRLKYVLAIVKWLEEYEKVRVLGVGGTGVVHELWHKNSKQRYAMKEMEIKSKAQMKMAISEAEMLKDIMENISHKNIMNIEKVFQVGSKFFLVFPLCTGGELYEHIIRRGHFTEYDAAIITRDLISGIQALHAHDILHLDIKPENILFDTMNDDAIIKITDFGLAKVFRHTDEEVKNRPTMSDMDEKLKAFSESGVLNRERLRGTIGYMSPELILNGYSSKAADIFAAGVVLYILLSGHPPFYSKSNREVLEKTARGQYRMDGSEWEGVSEEAKDLIRKMLVVDPAKRITADEVLKHPWLTNLDDEEIVTESETTAELLIDSKSLTASRTLSNARKTSNVNLGNALRNMTGLVNDMKIEKLATSFTRLISSMQNDKNSGSLLMEKLAVPKGSASIAGMEVVNDQEDMMLFMNPEVRDSFRSVFDTHGTVPGLLSIPQFMSILKYLMEQDLTVPVPKLELPAYLLCKFVDQDGDNMISAEDLFTSQALVMQRSESFMKAIFRLYAESIWYPGRQLNYLNLQAAVNAQQSTPSKSNSPRKSTPDNNKERTRVVEPPKFITGRHVAAVFEKMGYEPSGGMKCFTILMRALEKNKNDRISECDERDTFSPNTRNPSTDRLSNSTQGPNASLAAALGLDDQSSESQKYDEAAKRSSVGNDSPGDDITIKGKMSIKDFMKVSELDDVLIQVVLRRARHGLAKIIRKVEGQKDEAVPSQPNKSSIFSMSKSANKSQITRTSFVLKEFEKELDEALKTVPIQAKPTFPIANSVRRAAGGAILGLVNNIASNLTGYDNVGGDGAEYIEHSRRDKFSDEIK